MRHLCARLRAEGFGANRHVTSVLQLKIVGGKSLPHDIHGFLFRHGIARQKKLSESENRGQCPEAAEKIERQRKEKPCSVAFAATGGKSAAVGEAGHGGKRVFNNSVGGASVKAGYETDAAGVMFAAGMVKADMLSCHHESTDHVCGP